MLCLRSDPNPSAGRASAVKPPPVPSPLDGVFLTMGEVARALRVSTRTLGRYVRTGRFAPSFRIGGKRL